MSTRAIEIESHSPRWGAATCFRCANPVQRTGAACSALGIVFRARDAGAACSALGIVFRARDAGDACSAPGIVSRARDAGAACSALGFVSRARGAGHACPALEVVSVGRTGTRRSLRARLQRLHVFGCGILLPPRSSAPPVSAATPLAPDTHAPRPRSGSGTCKEIRHRARRTYLETSANARCLPRIGTGISGSRQRAASAAGSAGRHGWRVQARRQQDIAEYAWSRCKRARR
jgi:hypothetical protein